MKYLMMAEEYCVSHGDELSFKNLYTGFREFNGVEDSVWKTLSYLYNYKIANHLKNISN